MADRGTFILHFLRPSPLARSLPPCIPLRPPPLLFFRFSCSPPSYRLFFWFFPLTSPPLPLLCLALASKVTPGILVEKFGYLISYRGPPEFSLPLASFFYISPGSHSPSFSPHPSRFAVTHATKPSTFPRRTTVISCRALYCEITFQKKRFVARDFCERRIQQTPLYYVFISSSENIPAYVILCSCSWIACSSIQRYNDCRTAGRKSV